MVRFLIRTAIFLGSAALGLWVASLVLDGFTVTWQGFLVTVLVFAAAQSILAPFITKLAARNAPAFLGGVGLVSTFVALLIASVVANGLVITGWQTWVLAALVVWLVTALATVTLPLLFLRRVTQKGSDRT